MRNRYGAWGGDHTYRRSLVYGLVYVIVIVGASVGVLVTTSIHTQSAVLARLKVKDTETAKPLIQRIATKPPVIIAKPLPRVIAPTVADPFNAQPAWSQDFTTMSDGPLSSGIWAYDLGNGGPSNPGWGNNEVEDYTDSLSNARIEDGQLIIEAQKQSLDGFDYTSARITTTPSLNFTYGKIDIVAELPSGIGNWSAMWLLPSTYKYALTTPAAEQDPLNWLRDGEIDIMESTGSVPGQISSSAQSYTYNPTNNNERGAVENVADYATTFHDYELEWTPTSLTFLVDGVAYHTVTKSPTDTSLEWPYDQPFHLILNIAMGGTEGGTEAQQFPPYGIDDSSGPWEMTIKSINYYPYNGN